MFSRSRRSLALKPHDARVVERCDLIPRIAALEQDLGPGQLSALVLQQHYAVAGELMHLNA